MKHLALAVSATFLLTSSSLAMTDVGLVQSWQAAAADGNALFDESAPESELSPEQEMLVQRFALLSSHLSAAARSGEAPPDLACIFRGMSDESGAALRAFREADDDQARTRALARMDDLFRDAVLIGASIEADWTPVAPAEVPALEEEGIASCAAPSPLAELE